MSQPGTVRIVYASSDPESVALVRSALQPEQWPLEVVTDGDRCVAKFEKGAPDVVLLDLELPDIAGLDLLPQIRSIDGAVPVIIIAAAGPMEQAVAAMRLGATNYMNKPLNAAKLVA